MYSTNGSEYMDNFSLLNQDLEMLQNADCNRFQIKTLGECVKKLFKCVECTCVFKTG